MAVFITRKVTKYFKCTCNFTASEGGESETIILYSNIYAWLTKVETNWGGGRIEVYTFKW